MEQKICRQCQSQFTVTDDDIRFLEKVSPEFGGKKYLIPSPTLCVQCRSRRRLSWRNERMLYNRTCNMCGKNMVSLYHQDSPYKVYCQQCFWSDKWNPLENGREFDFNRPFFEQLAEVQKTSPRLNLLNNNSENTDYANHSARNRDSYLLFASFDNESSMYGRHVLDSKMCVDCDSTYQNSQYCYECDTINNCYKLTHSMFSIDCAESSFLYDCRNCKKCYRCVGLRNKEYCFENKQLNKEEYEKIVPSLRSRKVLNEERDKYKIFVENAIHVFAHLKNCENCAGEEITNCRKCQNCYDLEDSENCVNADLGESMINSCDCFGVGKPGENLYEIHGMLAGHNCAFVHASYIATNVYYADNCQSCQDIFGCVSLKKNQYCILNKQYSKEKYDRVVGEILEYMQKTGEWGEFMPTSLSPFAYNETFANYYFPLEKAGAEKIGAKWLDRDYSKKYEGETYQPKNNINDYIGDDKEREKLLGGVLKCEVTGKAYKIMSRELAFYLEQGISIPTKHPETRFKERFAMRNPRLLWPRQCTCEEINHGHTGRCPVTFQTTYAPNRPEKVYCEECYRKSVI